MIKKGKPIVMPRICASEGRNVHNHHTIHEGEECPVTWAVVTLQSRTIPMRGGHKAGRRILPWSPISQLAAEPFLNRLAAALALDTAIEQTQTDTNREPHNCRNDACQYKAHT